MIDINKNYKTSEGNSVRIYAIDACGNYPVHGAVKIADQWDATTWTNEGWYRRGVPSQLDLIEINEKEELLEEAKRRFPIGTKFISFYGIVQTVHSEPYFRNTKIHVITPISEYSSPLRVSNPSIYDEGQWAKVVKEHDMDLYIYEATAGFAVLNFKPQTAGLPYAKKKITFYEGEGL